MNKKFGIIVGILALLFLGLAAAQNYQYGMMGSDGQFTAVNNGGMGMMGMMQMMTGYGGYGSGMMFLGWITYLLTILLMIAAIYWLFKSANRRR